jgi:hypothetical protein
MRKFLIALVIFVALLFALDRAGVAIAERQISTRVQSAYSLPERPKVSIGGFPFLTQVVSGRYQDISVTISKASVGGVQVQDIQARFTGVHASLSLLLGQGSGSVTAAAATGTALIPYAQVQQRLPRGITLAAHGGSLRVTGNTPLGSVHSIVSLAVTRTGISVSADVLGSRLTYVIPVGTLPLHLSVTGVRAAGTGLVVAATGRNVTLTHA